MKKINILATIFACLILFNSMVLPVNANPVEELTIKENIVIKREQIIGEKTIAEECSGIEENMTEDLPKEQRSEFSELIIQTRNEKFDEVPLYFQTDYPDTPFSKGTIATSGCGITCLAMISTYLLDEEHFPDELAEKYNNSGDNNMARLEYGIKDLKLPMTQKTFSRQETFEALENGQVVILLMNSESLFTDIGHFIVLKGITEDGKVLVNDPYEPNYKNPRIKYGFENGFSKDDIITGFSGAWIFDKNKTFEEIEAEKQRLEALNNIELNFPVVH